jgi:lipocalin
MLVNSRVFQILFLSLILLLSSCGLADKNADMAAEFSLDNYKGKWLILNYWAEW